MSSCPCSVIIPVLDEEELLGETLDAIRRQISTEILVVDGGSRDRTCEVARRRGVRLLRSAPGRARQMNAGAWAATSRWLLFLHADTRPRPGALRLLLETLPDPRVEWGAFQLRIQGSREDLYLRLTEAMVWLRTHFLRLPYGDQGLFVRRSRFLALGGFREAAACEDMDLVLRLRRLGAGRILGAQLETSSRAWQRQGRLRTWRRHLRAQAHCLLGR